MATPSLSGTAAGVGYGNKRDESDPDLSQDHADTRYGIEHTNAYTGGSSTYPSGTVGGTGSGNKLDAARDSADLSEQHSNTRYNIAAEGAPYVDGDERFKSGTVGGPGIGNKTAGPKTDSTSGKLMEKIGSITNNEAMVETGREKRAQYTKEDPKEQEIS